MKHEKQLVTKLALLASKTKQKVTNRPLSLILTNKKDKNFQKIVVIESNYSDLGGFCQTK